MSLRVNKKTKLPSSACKRLWMSRSCQGLPACVCMCVLSQSVRTLFREKTLLHRGSSLGWCRHESCFLISPLFSMEKRKRQDRSYKSFFHESIGTLSGKTTFLSDRAFIHLNRSVGESGTRCHQKNKNKTQDISSTVKSSSATKTKTCTTGSRPT